MRDVEHKEGKEANIMEIYRVTGDSPQWQLHAYNYIRTDAFCVGQNIPVELEFHGDKGTEDFEGILLVEAHKPVSGLRITYPKEGIAKIERVCTVREKQKGTIADLPTPSGNWKTPLHTKSLKVL